MMRSVHISALFVMLAAGPTTACAHKQLQAARAHQCPQGTFDYGDGMVAATLPQNVTDVLAAAHDWAVRAAGEQLSPFLRQVPWRPHISIICGVTSERATSAQRAMQAYLSQHDGTTTRFGPLTHWDDPKSGKTTVMVAIDEPQGMLAGLHDALAAGCNIKSRFAYHPHVTLAFLNLGARLDAETQGQIDGALRGLQWSSQAFELTNPCGQTIAEAQAGRR